MPYKNYVDACLWFLSQKVVLWAGDGFQLLHGSKHTFPQLRTYPLGLGTPSKDFVRTTACVPSTNNYILGGNVF
jgi:hypothetical protein